MKVESQGVLSGDSTSQQKNRPEKIEVYKKYTNTTFPNKVNIFN